MLTRSAPAFNKDLAPGFHPPSHPELEGSSDQAPVTEGILVSLFVSLKSDIHDLKRDLSQDIRDLQQNLVSVGNMVPTLEDAESAEGEEVEVLCQEVLHLQKQHDDLKAHAEDLGNRSFCNNICL
ncbi:hypothetical protein NDU88_003591 [Pleurodeles waltl]|uniref:Uncharacterized protein n=1 Tax=Pleurodeles waltl TaxID=8319 RepID=A0AAV7VDR3_PLEWA|nr:hypothetical protein NDU88_003591 [Pleurodeles waltl]